MKIIAIASAGGHWIQLLRLIPSFEMHEVVFISTKPGFGEMVKGKPYFSIPDSNRNNKLGLIKSFYHITRLVFQIKPQLIITTGAAPGLMALTAGKLLGAKTIWIDSIANVEKLSLSGKIASYFCDKVYTQWPDLASSNIIYHGNVIAS